MFAQRARKRADRADRTRLARRDASADDGARLDVRLFDCAVVEAIEVVDNGDAMSAGYERIDEMAANEPGPTSDEHTHAASQGACRSAWAGERGLPSPWRCVYDSRAYRSSSFTAVFVDVIRFSR